MDDERLHKIVTAIDTVVEDNMDLKPHEIGAILLSRFTHVMSADPETGLGLLKHVAQQFELIDRGTRNLGKWL
jgi:hypothetical protein